MDEGQNKLLLALAAALLAIVAFLVLVDPPEKDLGGGDDKVEYAKLVPDAKAEDVASFSLTRGDIVLRFARVEGGWTVQQGEAAPIAADDTRVDDLLADALGVELAEDPREDRAAPADLSAFELAPPRAVLTWTMVDGATHSLRVGGDSPVGFSTYVQTTDGGPVRTTRARLGTITGGTGTADDFRSREAVALDLADVTGVQLSRAASTDGTGGLDLRLEEDPHGWWVAGVPRVRADETRVQDLLADLRALRVSSFPGASASPAEPATTVRVVEGDQTLELVLGASSEGGRVARVPLHDQPVLLEDDLDATLARGAEGWFEVRLLPIRSAEASGLEVKLGDATLSVDRGPEGWTGQGAAFLDALRAVRVDRTIAADAPTGEPWGNVRLKHGESGESVRIHQVRADGARVVIDEAGGPPFLLPASELARLTEALQATD